MICLDDEEVGERPGPVPVRLRPPVDLSSVGLSEVAAAPIPGSSKAASIKRMKHNRFGRLLGGLVSSFPAFSPFMVALSRVLLHLLNLSCLTLAGDSGLALVFQRRWDGQDTLPTC